MAHTFEYTVVEFTEGETPAEAAAILNALAADGWRVVCAFWPDSNRIILER